LHTVLVARVGVDDVPVARLRAQRALELLDRVLDDVAVLVDRALVGGLVVRRVVGLVRLLVGLVDLRDLRGLVHVVLGTLGLRRVDVLRLVQRLLGHERTCFLANCSMTSSGSAEGAPRGADDRWSYAVLVRASSRTATGCPSR